MQREIFTGRAQIYYRSTWYPFTQRVHY